jgi:DnaA-homolog protein
MSSSQIPLALRFPADQRLDRYVGAPPALLAALRALATEDGGDWVYLSGAAGSGKTHLCLATCAEAGDAGRAVAYFPLATLAGRLEAALSGEVHSDLVVLDGLDAVAGNAADEVALFDFHNRARGTGVGVLYTGSVDPMSLPLQLPDLRSRLAQCVRFALAPLDDTGRREVLRQRAQARGLSLDDPVLDWLLTRVGRDLGTLGALLDRLDRESLAAQRRITIPFLRQLLGTRSGG